MILHLILVKNAAISDFSLIQPISTLVKPVSVVNEISANITNTTSAPVNTKAVSAT